MPTKNPLSLRTKFLIAPILALTLTLLLFLSGNFILENHKNIFKEIQQSNLPQIGESSRLNILLTDNQRQLTQLLISTIDKPDEETVYIKGRLILNQLHELKDQFHSAFTTDHNSPIFQKILEAFDAYRLTVVDAIEMSTVDAGLAKNKLKASVMAVAQINQLMLQLSEKHIISLRNDSELVKSSIFEHQWVTILAIIFLVLMTFIAIYFSNRLTGDINKIGIALKKLTQGDTNIENPNSADHLLKQFDEATIKFKDALIQNKEHHLRLEDNIIALEDSKNRYFTLLDLTATAMIAIDTNHRLVLFNKAAEQLFEYTSEEILGQPLALLIPPEIRSVHDKMVDHFLKGTDETHYVKRAPLKGFKKSGEIFDAEIDLAKMTLSHETLITAAITDVTERIYNEKRIWHQAHYDSLTDLPNRRLAMEHLSEWLESAKRTNSKVAILFIDLDDFKKINDSLGHPVGDALLVEAADRLKQHENQQNLIARLGGDEFVILVKLNEDSDELLPLTNRLLEAFRQPFTVNDRELLTTLSIGISVYPDNGEQPFELLRKADSAMYYAKQHGRNTYVYYTNEMNESITRRLLIEEQINSGLMNQEFEVHYQPKFNIRTQKIVGAEALIRWHNPILGRVTPEVFIPVAEQNGQIIELGQFVFDTAFRDHQRLLEIGFEKFRMAINLSPAQFRDPKLLQKLEKLQTDFQVPAHLIELEITEGVLISGYKSVNLTISDIKAHGYNIAIDDFGTGYSSLNYLKNYEFDTLKIDKAFVKDAVEYTSDQELIKAIISMSHALKLKVVAEGIETATQLEMLADYSCDIAQGYYLGKPMPLEELIERMENQKAHFSFKAS